MDPANNIFFLNASSPCIDTGDPSFPLDPDGSIADMGAFHYIQYGFGSVEGVVTNSETGLPIQDAIITIGSDQVITNVNGEYSIELLPNTYQLTCEHDEYEFYSHPDEIIVIENEITQIGIELIPLSGSQNITMLIKSRLIDNYPNPFNPITTIYFSISDIPSLVNIEIYNIKGQKVKTLVNEQLAAGQYSITWNGKDDSNKSVSSGLYFYRMINNNYMHTKKMILLK